MWYLIHVLLILFVENVIMLQIPIWAAIIWCNWLDPSTPHLFFIMIFEIQRISQPQDHWCSFITQPLPPQLAATADLVVAISTPVLLLNRNRKYQDIILQQRSYDLDITLYSKIRLCLSIHPCSLDTESTPMPIHDSIFSITTCYFGRLRLCLVIINTPVSLLVCDCRHQILSLWHNGPAVTKPKLQSHNLIVTPTSLLFLQTKHLCGATELRLWALKHDFTAVILWFRGAFCRAPVRLVFGILAALHMTLFPNRYLFVCPTF